jgi:LacI family transcriptional regulator
MSRRLELFDNYEIVCYHTIYRIRFHKYFNRIMAEIIPPKRTHAITMRDVARKANVSQSTVSRILTATPSKVAISKETRDKVNAVIKELGYHPNQYARSLRGRKVHVIGMLIADISNPFYHPMVRAVQDVAFRNHYDVMIANSDHMREKELLFCESIERRPVDGVVLIPYYLDDEDLDRLITRTGVVISVVGNHIRHPEVDVTFADDAKASYDAIRWLIETKGHRRIAMICASHDFQVTKRRYGAFRQAMQEANLEVPEEFIIETDWSFESGQKAIKTLIEQPEPPTAVFAASDTIAIGALVAAKAMNVRVPEDIAILGFDNIPEASWVQPRLTSVAQYPEQMGYNLANALFQRLEGDYEGPCRRFEVPCQLIEREST